jgi:hypothetical protein
MQEVMGSPRARGDTDVRLGPGGDRGYGRIYELGEEQTSEVYTVSCSTKTVGLEQFWA